MKQINAGIDIGYHATKVWADGGVSATIPSVIGTPDMPVTSFNTAMSDRHIVVQPIEQPQYLVGESALRLSRITQRREDRGWIMEPEYGVLLMAALAIVAQNAPSAEVFVTTGLPVSYYDSDAKELASVFNGEHIGRVNGEKCHYTVKAQVTTQGYGGFMDLLMNDHNTMQNERLLNSVVGIIDIGGHTTNIQTISNTESIRPQTVSFPLGGWDLVRAVNSEISQRYPDVDMRDHQVAQAIVNRSFNRFGKPENISDLVDQCINPVVREILSRTSQLWGSASGVDEVYVMGGGALLFGGALVAEFPQGQIASDPAMANARGYWKYTNVWRE